MNKPMEKGCMTCKYGMLGLTEGPCGPCSHSVLYGNWEPMDFEVYEKPKLCSECAYGSSYTTAEDVIKRCAECSKQNLWTPPQKVGRHGDIKGKTHTQLIIDDPEPILEGSAASSKHYQVGAIQPIEYLQMVLTPEEFQGFCKGNIIKYSSRCGHKDTPSKEAAKSEQYSKWLRMSLEGQIINPREDK